MSDMARAMMIHSAVHWPEKTDLDLWPFAMEYAAYLYNRIPKHRNGISPLEVLSSSPLDKDWVKTARVWECPAYVLDPTLQDGKKLPRWQPKARRGQFLSRTC